MGRLEQLMQEIRSESSGASYYYPPGEAKKLVTSLRRMGMKVVHHGTSPRGDKDPSFKNWAEWELGASDVSDSSLRKMVEAVRAHARKRNLKKKVLRKGDDHVDIAYVSSPEDLAQVRVTASKKFVALLRQPRPKDWTEVSVYVQSWGG
jgi:hypothetical protein